MREQLGKLDDKAAYQERVKTDAKLGGECSLSQEQVMRQCAWVLASNQQPEAGRGLVAGLQASVSA